MGVVETAKKYIGKVQYEFGRNDVPGGKSDCSAFIQYVLKENKIQIGRSTTEQVKAGKEVKRENLIAGDLVFFQNTYRKGVSHVGIYIGNNQFIHNSSSAKTVVVSELRSYFLEHWHSGRRVLSENTLKSGTETDSKSTDIPSLTDVIDIIEKHKKVKIPKEPVVEYVKKQMNDNLFTLAILANGNTYYPVVKSGVTIDWERNNSPGKMTFTVLKDKKLNFNEGDMVQFFWNKKPVFCGYVFEKSRNSLQEINVTCYDQLRYLKNKDYVIIENKKANELIKEISRIYGLKTGVLENTKYVIKNRVEDNVSWIDIILTALDITLLHTCEMYVFYDLFGELTLKNIKNMQLDLLICEETIKDYSYTSSIDSNTYNYIRLQVKDGDVVSEPKDISDEKNIKKWGVLQYYEEVEKEENIDLLLKSLLNYYNRKTRNITINSAFGDIRVRGGTLLPVILKLGDTKLNNYMIVEKVTHKFESIHTMDLTLRGCDFSA